MELSAKEIKDELDSARSLALFTHINCDCDGIGCILGLYDILTKSGKNVQLFCDSEIPERFSFLKNYEKINLHEKNNQDAFNKEELKHENEVDFSKFDLLVSLDSSNTQRLGKYEEAYKNAEKTINIDHHVSNTNYATINYVKSYSSCGEVLFELLKEMNYEIEADAATCLFAAISSDTNRFSNSNITALTHKYAGELIDLGADYDAVNINLHKNKTINQLRLIAYMAKKLQYYKGVTYFYAKIKDLKKLQVKSSDVTTFMHIICNVGDSKINITVKERGNNEYRLGLRSIENYDVNRVASVFGGGGHKNASGCNIHGNFKKEFKKVLDECVKEIQRNDNKSM